MIRENAPLRRQVADLFTQHLLGVYSYDNVRYEALREHIAPAAGWRRDNRPDGKWQERVEARFGPFYLDVQAPALTPPLGLVQLRFGDKVLVEGINESETWHRVAAAIKQHKESEHGDIEWVSGKHRHG